MKVERQQSRARTVFNYKRANFAAIKKALEHETIMGKIMTTQRNTGSNERQLLSKPLTGIYRPHKLRILKTLPGLMLK